MVRSINEILADADKATTIGELERFYNEIFDNKKKYPLVQLWFCQEHIGGLLDKILERDREFLRALGLNPTF